MLLRILCLFLESSSLSGGRDHGLCGADLVLHSDLNSLETNTKYVKAHRIPLVSIEPSKTRAQPPDTHHGGSTLLNMSELNKSQGTTELDMSSMWFNPTEPPRTTRPQVSNHLPSPPGLEPFTLAPRFGGEETCNKQLASVLFLLLLRNHFILVNKRWYPVKWVGSRVRNWVVCTTKPIHTFTRSPRCCQDVTAAHCSTYKSCK